MYDLEQQRPSLVTFHQTNRLHDGLQPLNLHFTNQRKYLIKDFSRETHFEHSSRSVAPLEAASPHYSTLVAVASFF